MPCRNPHRLYIHLAFTYSLHWSLKRSVKLELGPPTPPSPPTRVLEVQFSHGPAVLKMTRNNGNNNRLLNYDMASHGALIRSAQEEYVPVIGETFGHNRLRS